MASSHSLWGSGPRYCELLPLSQAGLCRRNDASPRLDTVRIYFLLVIPIHRGQRGTLLLSSLRDWDDRGFTALWLQHLAPTPSSQGKGKDKRESCFSQKGERSAHCPRSLTQLPEAGETVQRVSGPRWWMHTLCLTLRTSQFHNGFWGVGDEEHPDPLPRPPPTQPGRKLRD